MAQHYLESILAAAAAPYQHLEVVQGTYLTAIRIWAYGLLIAPLGLGDCCEERTFKLRTYVRVRT